MMPMVKLVSPPDPKVAKGVLTARSHPSIKGLDLRDIVNVKSRDSVYTYKFSHARKDLMEDPYEGSYQQTHSLGKVVTL